MLGLSTVVCYPYGSARLFLRGVMTKKETQDYGSHIMQMVGDLATVKQTTADTLAQAIRTNGRVTKLEETVAVHSAKILLTDAVDAAALVKANWWKDKIGTALISIFFAGVGAALLLLFQKTDIIDVTSVSAEDYDRVDAITSIYEDSR